MRTQPTGLAQPAIKTFPGPVQQFTDPAEFMEQLRDDRANVRHGTVRTTKEQRSPGIGRCEELRVLAGYLVDLGDGGLRRVELDHYCGTLLGTDRDGETLARADSTVQTVAKAVRRCGLTPRAGRLIVKEPRPVDRRCVNSPPSRRGGPA